MGDDKKESGDDKKPSAVPTSHERGLLKSKVSRETKLLRRRIAEKRKQQVQDQIEVLMQVFDSFENYHVLYHATLIDDGLIDKSVEYFDEIETTYMNALDEANVYLDNVKTSGQVSVQEKTLELLDNQSLAQLTLSTFDGNDVLDYLPWITVFDETVDKKNIPKPIKLARLLQYTSGSAHRHIRHCPLDKITGYESARKILADTYGAPHVILQKTMDSLKSGPLVNSAEDLVLLSNDLQMALNTVADLSLLCEVDNQLVIRDILKRCPNYLQTKYRNYVTDFKFEKSKYPGFKEFVNFIQKWARKQSDPIWSSSWSETECTGSTYLTCDSMSFIPKSTQTEPEPHVSACHNDQQSASQCFMCGEAHLLYHCSKFKSLPHAEKMCFVNDKKLCLLCFGNNHNVDNCRSPYRCTALNSDDSVCNAMHSRSIHCDLNMSNTVDNSTTGSANLTVRDNANVYLPTVPIVLPNANVSCSLIDGSSCYSFMSTALVTKLNLKTKPINCNIGTMSGSSKYDRSVSCQLQSLDGKTVFVENIIVTNKLPVRHPVTKASSLPYSHLSDISLDHVDYDNEIHMLIGSDQPHLIRPYEVRSDSNDENTPFATRSYFGWSLTGPVVPISLISSREYDGLHSMSNSDTTQSAKYSRNQPTADNVRSQSLLKHRWQMKTQQPKASTQLKNIKPPGSCSTVQSNRPYHLSFQLPLSAHSMLDDRKSMYQSRLLNDRKCTYQPRKVSYSWSNSGVRIFQPHSSR